MSSENYGRLIIDNGGHESPEAGTPIRSVGLHTVQSATDLGDGRWKIAIGPDALHRVVAGEVSPIHPADYHQLDLDQAREIAFTDGEADFNAHLYVYRDDGDLDAGDLLDNISIRSGGNERVRLAAGEYLLAVCSGGIASVASEGTMARSVVARGSPCSRSQYLEGGSYTISLDSVDGVWAADTVVNGRALDGLSVSLNANDQTAKVYTIESNSNNALIIRTTDDLSGYVGKQLIGIRYLRSLQVTNGANVSFGGDRLVIVNIADSKVDSTSSIGAGEMGAATINMLGNEIVGSVHLDRLTNTGVLGLSDVDLAVNEPLQVDTLGVGGGAVLTALNIDSGSVIVDNGTLVTQSLNVQNDLDILNQGVVTAPPASQNALGLSIVASSVDIGPNSGIDLDGKGYPYHVAGPYFYHWWGGYPGNCHGGEGLSYTDCTYGRYDYAKLPGSGSDLGAGTGGGALSMTVTGAVNIDGFIRANGGHEGYAGGAGGAIEITADTLTGTGTITADGGDVTTSYKYASGAGGRIHLTARDRSELDLATLSAAAGMSDGQKFSGAGTIYLDTPDGAPGTLIVDNDGRRAPADSTPIRAVGLHTISSIQPSGNGLWTVSVGQDTSVHIRQDGHLAAAGDNAYLDYSFTLSAPAEVAIALPSRTVDTDFDLYARGSQSEHEEYLTRGENDEILKRSLPAGNYLVEVHAADYVAGDFTLRIDTVGGTWRASDTQYGWGLDGMQVVLDASDPNAPVYTILSNTDESLIIQTSDDLTKYVGKQLRGIKTFNVVKVMGGASVDFGHDKVIVTDLADSVVDGQSGFRAGLIEEAFQNKLLNAGTGLRLRLDHLVSLSNTNLLLSSPITLTLGETLAVDSLSVGQGFKLVAPSMAVGSMTLDGGTVVTQSFGATGDVSLLDGAVLTVPSATADPAHLYPLNMIVTGMLTVDATSIIDLNGKGYPAPYYSGPDFGDNTRPGCHGGMGTEDNSSCVYGRYDLANLAGSAYQGAGGGAALITAGGLTLNGTIRANGMRDGNYGGAGGGLRIETAAFKGSGSVEAHGAGQYYERAGGGRIALYAADKTAFTGAFDVAGGNYGSRTAGGAGTVYIKNPSEAYGNLIIGNGGYASVSRGTPMRNVGRHIIQSVTQLTAGKWQVAIGNEPLHDSSQGTVASSVVYHKFTLLSNATVDINITSGNFDTYMYLFRDDGDLTTDDEVESDDDGGQGTLSEINRQLTAGNYIVAIGGYSLSLTNAVNGDNTGAQGDFRLSISSATQPTWRASSAGHGWGLDGLNVVLDDSDPDAKVYTIDSNAAESLTINTTDDLSGYVGKELQGVQFFNTLNVTGGASVDFGNDQVIVEDLAHSVIDSTSNVTAGSGSVLPPQQ